MTLLRMGHLVITENIEEIKKLPMVDKIGNVFIPYVFPGKHVQLIFPTPLQLAVYLSKYEMAHYLLSLKIDPNELNKLFGLACIHLCVFNNDVEMLRMLVNAGANVNLVGDNGETPLLLACAIRAFDCALTLLELGANPNGNEDDPSALNPLQVSVSGTYPELVALLMQKGANADHVTFTGCKKIDKIRKIIEGGYEKDEYSIEKMKGEYSTGLMKDAEDFELPEIKSVNIDKRYTSEEFKKELKERLKDHKKSDD